MKRGDLPVRSVGSSIMNSGTNQAVRILSLIATASLALAGSALGWAAARPAETRARAKSVAATAAVPSTKKILRKYLNATGGRKAWERVHSRVSQGTVAVPSMDLAGTALMFEEAPDRALVKIVISGSTFLEGFDGRVAWSSDPKDGLRRQTGAQLAETRRESDFRFPADFRKIYATVSAPTRASIGQQAVYVVDATPAEGGQPDRAYFDAQTGLLVRLVTQHHEDDGSVEPFEQDFSDYRAVDGIKIPFAIHQSGAQVDFTIRLQTVRQNVPVNDSQFSEPVNTRTRGS